MSNEAKKKASKVVKALFDDLRSRGPTGDMFRTGPPMLPGPWVDRRYQTIIRQEWRRIIEEALNGE